MPEIMARVQRRKRIWKHVIDEVLPDPRDLNETCIVGGFAICGMETKTRWLLKGVCLPTDEGMETPSTLARDYLATVYKKSPWASHKQLVYLRNHTAPLPLWADPRAFRAGYYLDIVSTYYTLMLAAGWNIDYWPGQWFAAGRPPADFPWADHKLARNCLVSAGMSSKVTIYKPGVGYFQKFTGNQLANIQLFCFISDLLNAVAGQMVKRAGAIYVNTDGYILTNYQSLEAAMGIVGDWKLPPHIKASGPGIVRGTASYHFGPGRPKRKAAPGATGIQKIAPVAHANWLQDHYARFVEMRGIAA